MKPRRSPPKNNKDWEVRRFIDVLIEQLNLRKEWPTKITEEKTKTTGGTIQIDIYIITTNHMFHIWHSLLRLQDRKTLQSQNLTKRWSPFIKRYPECLKTYKTLVSGTVVVKSFLISSYKPSISITERPRLSSKQMTDHSIMTDDAIYYDFYYRGRFHFSCKRMSGKIFRTRRLRVHRNPYWVWVTCGSHVVPV